jgi:hypothetical protein
MKRPRFETIKMRVRRDILHGSSRNVANFLSRKMKKNQRLVYLKHNTLVGSFAYWTAIVENLELVTFNVRIPKKKKSGRRAS